MDRYEEAMNRMLQWEKEHPDGYDIDAMKSFVFPELTESEDERIRKLLIWQVHRNIEDETNDLAQSVYDGIKGHDPDLEESIEDWKKCLAYLEKQKEQKPSTPEDIAAAYQMGLAEGRKEQKPALYWHKIKAYDHLPCKAYIYKFAYEQENNFHGECHIDGFLMPNEPVKIGCDTWYLPVEDIKNLPKEEELDTASSMKTVEQQPAEWNEEDEITVRTLIDFIGSEQSNIQGYGKTKYIAWLSSLPKRFNPQPKQEWSEEDEQFLLVCKNALQKYQSSDKWDAAIIYNWLENRLKSIRLQPHWKPTKVQLDALAIASERVDSSPLKALYNDLQKLM